jgi:3-hydroxyacyl-[acyl-carrier-protein] dehydratase
MMPAGLHGEPGGMKTAPALLRSDIQERLPHRDPFLFLESVAHVDSREATGTAVWPADHPILAGHFPGMAIVPGVCLVEAAAQLAGVVLVEVARQAGRELGEDRLGMLTGIRSAKFLMPVLPGQAITIRVRLRAVLPNLWAASASGTLRDEEQSDREVFLCDLTLYAAP